MNSNKALTQHTGNDVELQWCIYRYVFPTGIGRIERNHGQTVYIRYSEGQLYPPEAWDINYIQRFSTIDEAIAEFARQTGQHEHTVQKKVHACFPSAMERSDSPPTTKGQVPMANKADTDNARPIAETQLSPGQIWWDKDHKWCDGNLDVVYLLLSADMEDGRYLWKAAHFMWCSPGYCGAQVRELNEDEIRLMHLVGNMSDVISFQHHG